MKYCLSFLLFAVVLGNVLAEDGVLFSATYKKSIIAETAKGGGTPRSGRGGIAEDGGLNAAAEGFRPYRYSLKGNISSKAGTIEFKYKPMLPDFPASSKGTVFTTMMQAKAGGPQYNGLSIGLNLKPGNKKYVWLIIKAPKRGVKTSQIYRLAELKNGQWYKFAACWDSDKIAFFIDGKMLGQIPRPEKILGGTQLKIGGANEKDFAHGLIADFKIYDKFIYSTESKKTPTQFAKCLKLEFPGKKANVILRYNRRAPVNSKQFGVIVDSPLPVILKLSSDKFKINPDKLYAVNYSERPPQYIKADGKGILSIPLSKTTNYSNILITEVDSKNLLADAKWHGRVSSETYTALGWGHEGTGVDSAVSKGTVKAGTFSRDNGAFVLEKKVRDGEVKWFSDAFNVEAGKEYLLYGYYSIKRPYYGGTAMFRAVLRGDGKKDKICRGIFINPLIAPQNGAKERYMQVRIKVPGGYTKCYVVLALRGAAQKISWDKLAVRPAPKKLYSQSVPLSIKDSKFAYSLKKVREIWSKRPARSIKIKKASGLAILMIDNKPLPLLAYNHYVIPSASGESKAMLRNGVNWQFVRLKSYLHQWWQGKNKYDFSGIQESIETVLRFDPNAVIMLNIKITPWYREWGYEYPDAVWRNHDGKKTAGYKNHIYYPGNKPLGKGRWDKWAAGYSTEGYRKSVSQALRALAKHLKTFTAGKAVAGAVFWSGTDNQWFPHVKYKGFDFSTGAEKDFRHYLKEKYSTVSKLRKAWGDSNVTFTNAKLSPFVERSKDGMFFLNPAKGSERRVIDSNKYGDAGVSKTINYLGGEFKKAMGRNVYVCVYAPDIMQGYSGRSARKILLESNDLDGVVSVPDYGLWRLPGRTGNYSSAISSLGLHGKIMLAEFDYRTHLSQLAWDAYPRLTSQMGGVTNAKQFANQIRRDLGMLAAQGGGAWFLAMNNRSYNKPEYMKAIKEAATAMKLMANKPMPYDRGQIGVFSDEDTRNVCQFRYGMSINNVGIGMARMPLLRSGVSWDAYYLSDIDTPGRHKYKVYLFLSAPTISAKQISWIKKNLQRDGNVLVFVNAVGMTFDAGSFKSISKELTGMNIKYDMTKVSVLRVVPAKSSDKMAKGLRDNVLSEMKQPIFYVDDKTATTVGLVKGTNKTGWAVKRFKDWTSVYVSLPGAITPELIRNIVAEAAITPVGPCDDVTTAGNGFMTIHALYDGEKTLRWDKKCDLLDLATGKLAGKNIDTISFPMEAGETRWFRKQ